MKTVLQILQAVASLALVASCTLLQADDEVRLDGHDLQIHVDWRWIGGDNGGYYPLRIEVVNKGAARDVEFAFACRDAGFPGAKRSLKLDAGATTRFTLLVPLARERSSGQFLASIAGEPLEGLAYSITLPDADSGDVRPAILVVSRSAPNLGPLETALPQFHQVWTPSNAPGSFPAASWAATVAMSWNARPSNHRIIAPEGLPENWLAYSTVDFAILARDDLSALQPAQRRALLDWTAAGGTLIVTATGQLPADDPALSKLLGLPAATGWSLADRRRRSQGAPALWPLDPSPFAVRRSGLGQIAVLPGDPFDAGEGAAVSEDWQWLLRSLPMYDLSWTQRYGGSLRTVDTRFLEFLIPDQRSVPVGAMLVLVTLFTLAIGPLNYWLAWRRHRLSLLLLTVPGFSLATTLLLLLFSLVAFGFTAQARVRSLTMLDQASQTASTIARISLYDPFAPGAGPAFSADSAVIPLHGPGSVPRLDPIDWTERQQLGPGWLPSRTRTQFLTVSPHAERRRLEIRPSGSGDLSLSNGFEIGLKAVLASDDRGEVFVGRAVPAGGGVELKPADAVARRAFLTEWQADPLELPDDLDSDLVKATSSIRRGFWGPRRHYRPQAMTASSPGLLEDLWADCGRLIEADGPLPPRTFLAILEANPGVSTGVSHVVERGSIHVLRGSY
ncbi:hypothetical protein [Planctellipticum variicoloris]|uniref:hypothetical protein n=1 Tax=Planctellipticum variicoloris TaxID=3064265 RepID=UPI0030136CDF|nr:hypothetical protein SH412_005020 [Planctomycetaceae bacterium SH412]